MHINIFKFKFKILDQFFPFFTPLPTIDKLPPAEFYCPAAFYVEPFALLLVVAWLYLF
jgi:hypothetical protein